VSSILLVEDDSTLAMGMEYSLKSEGFNIDVANNIQAARKIYSCGKYDLLLLDVMLPDGSGYDFCREVREKSDVPIVFLTSCDDEVNVVLGLDMGGDDYITKPFRLKELISRIRAVLRRNGKQNTDSGEVIVSGEIQVYTLQGKVKKNNEDIILTALEYRLLLIFIKHPGQVLSRNFILEQLWDIDGDFVDDNTLSVYIKRLRGKIEKDPVNPVYIVTSRGLGYKWDREARGE